MRIAGRVVAGIAAALLLSIAAARAQAVSFENKTITIYSANSPGGSYDLYMRLVARHLGDHLPGKPTFVASNMPGGGGMIAANFIYNAAPKDGTALAVLLETIAVEQALGNPAVRYDATKFNWIGRVAASNNISFMWHTAKVQSIEDAKTTQAIVAGTGPGQVAEMVPRLLNAVVGTKFKVISGYPSSTEAMLAMERGEVEGAESSWAAVKVNKQPWLKEKKIKIILQMVPERDKELPDVPTIVEVGRSDEEKKILGIYASNGVIGRAVLAPPGLAPEVTAALREGFDEMVKDPAFVAEIKGLNIDLDPLAGAELQAIATKILDMPDAVRDKAKAYLGR